MIYKKKIKDTILKVLVGDITKLKVGAVVNAANQALLGGGGLDGAIHSAAGPELVNECKKLAGCPAGEARITSGFMLPVDYIIHAVGPVYFSDSKDVSAKLANAYYRSLLLASEYNIKTIAFPAIATGVFGYPVEEAAEIAVREVVMFVEGVTLKGDGNDNERHKFEEITFSCYSDESAQHHIQIIEEVVN